MRRKLCSICLVYLAIFAALCLHFNPTEAKSSDDSSLDDYPVVNHIGRRAFGRVMKRDPFVTVFGKKPKKSWFLPPIFKRNNEDFFDWDPFFNQGRLGG